MKNLPELQITPEVVRSCELKDRHWSKLKCHDLKLGLTETQPLCVVGRASLGFWCGRFDITNCALYLRIWNIMVASWLW